MSIIRKPKVGWSKRDENQSEDAQNSAKIREKKNCILKNEQQKNLRGRKLNGL